MAWAAFFNFVAFLVFGAHVAQTVGTGIVSADIVDPRVVFGALMGAIVWNIITWALGIPSIELARADRRAGRRRHRQGRRQGDRLGRPRQDQRGDRALAAHRLRAGDAAVPDRARGCSCATRPLRSTALFRSLQFVSASLYSLGHGGNDAQKTMGIIAVLLYSQGYLGGEFHVPFWVMLSCYAAMGLGTLFGGWRIVHTMGSRITRLTPFQGFCAETGGAITLFAATELGIPVSTTHTITGCIIGVGAARRVSSVRWSVANNIVVAWIITIPASAFIAALFYAAVGLFE